MTVVTSRGASSDDFEHHHLVVPLTISGDVLEGLIAEVTRRVVARLDGNPDATAWPEWMAIETAARYLDVPVERLRKLVARREMPFHQEGPGCRWPGGACDAPGPAQEV